MANKNSRNFNWKKVEFANMSSFGDSHSGSSSQSNSISANMSKKTRSSQNLLCRNSARRPKRHAQNRFGLNTRTLSDEVTVYRATESVSHEVVSQLVPQKDEILEEAEPSTAEKPPQNETRQSLNSNEPVSQAAVSGSASAAKAADVTPSLNNVPGSQSRKLASKTRNKSLASKVASVQKIMSPAVDLVSHPRKRAAQDNSGKASKSQKLSPLSSKTACKNADAVPGKSVTKTVKARTQGTVRKSADSRIQVHMHDNSEKSEQEQLNNKRKRCSKEADTSAKARTTTDEVVRQLIMSYPSSYKNKVKYRCKKCAYGSISPYTMETHREEKACPSQFKSMSSCSVLIESLCVNTKFEKAKKKTSTNIKISTTTVRRNTSAHVNASTFVCRKCEEAFVSMDAYNFHVEHKHHQLMTDEDCQPQNITCRTCHATFFTTVALNLHECNKSNRTALSEPILTNQSLIRCNYSVASTTFGNHTTAYEQVLPNNSLATCGIPMAVSLPHSNADRMEVDRVGGNLHPSSCSQSSEALNQSAEFSVSSDYNCSANNLSVLPTEADDGLAMSTDVGNGLAMPADSDENSVVPASADNGSVMPVLEDNSSVMSAAGDNSFAALAVDSRNISHSAPNDSTSHSSVPLFTNSSVLTTAHGNVHDQSTLPGSDAPPKCQNLHSVCQVCSKLINSCNCPKCVAAQSEQLTCNCNGTQQQAAVFDNPPVLSPPLTPPLSIPEELVRHNISNNIKQGAASREESAVVALSASTTDESAIDAPSAPTVNEITADFMNAPTTNEIATEALRVPTIDEDTGTENALIKICEIRTLDDDSENEMPDDSARPSAKFVHHKSAANAQFYTITTEEQAVSSNESEDSEDEELTQDMALLLKHSYMCISCFEVLKGELLAEHLLKEHGKSGDITYYSDKRKMS